MRIVIWTVTILTLAACTQSGPKDNDVGSETQSLRVATFNVSLYRKSEGQLKKDLSVKSDPQIEAVARIIREVDPDILLLNEFDYDTDGEALDLFQENYLSNVPESFESYPYTYIAPSNTGIASGVDLDNSGTIIATPGDRGYGNDAFGFGTFPGQYSFAVLSRYPIEASHIRSFQKFKWRDMPGNLMPTEYYSTAAQDIMRLSSKNHVDVPVDIDGQVIHVIATHPTPPSFDGPEDRNGRRNHDEIRLLADYIAPERSGYLIDDQGQTGGLPENASFVIMGDLNADPNDGDSYDNAIRLLLDHPLVRSTQPSSTGGAAAAVKTGGANADHINPADQDTADFRDDGDFAVGNLRLDYVLPSKNLTVRDSGVFWPAEGEPGYDWIGPGFPPVSSDHRLVWVDLILQ